MVFFSICASKGGFFVEANEDIEGCENEGHVEEQKAALEPQGFAEEEAEEADVHGVADIVVEALNHEFLGRPDGGGCAAANEGEGACRGEVDDNSEDDEWDA